MYIKELLRVMFHAFFVITTGVVISMYIICLLFKPDVILSLDDIGKILLIAFLCILSFIIFFSTQELSKQQMGIRIFIHILLLVIMLVYFGTLWHWVDSEKPMELAVFILLVLCVYAGTLAVIFYRDKKTAHKLNEGLKKRYDS